MTYGFEALYTLKLHSSSYLLFPHSPVYDFESNYLDLEIKMDMNGSVAMFSIA